MTLPSAPNPLSFKQIRFEFGPRIGPARLGDYRINGGQTVGTLQDLPLDTGIPKSVSIGSSSIKFSDFYNKRLNVVVDYFSGISTIYRSTARADFDAQNVVVVGNFMDVGSATTTSSGRRVIVNVNKTIGSQKSTLNPYICALRTGSGWESDTDLELEIGSSGKIAGSGGDGGDAGFTVSGRDPVSFVNSFGGAQVNSISLTGQVGDLVVLVSASSSTFQTTVPPGITTSIGDIPPPSGYTELNANKIAPNGDPNLPYYKVSYKTMGSTSETISGLTTSNSIHVASIFRGYQDFSGDIQYASSSTGTTVTFPTVSVDAESLVFVYGIVKDDNVLPITTSDVEYISIRNVDLGSGNDIIPGGSLVLGYRLTTSAGSVSPGSFTSSTWNGDGWVAGSIPLGGVLLGSSNINGKTGTSALGIQYPCTINNAGLILAGRGGGGAGGRGRGSTSARTQDGCEGFGRYIYAGGGGGGGGRGLPGGTGGTGDPTTAFGSGYYFAQPGFNGDINSNGGGGAGGYTGSGNCWSVAYGGNGGAGTVSSSGAAGGNGAAIVVEPGVSYSPPIGNLPDGSTVVTTVS